MPNGISKFAEKYFEEKFGNLHTKISYVKQDIGEIKSELKKNGICLGQIESTMKVYKVRVRHYGILITVLFLLLILGFATGLEVFSKGILGLIR